jgi:hypothetical protein
MNDPDRGHLATDRCSHREPGSENSAAGVLTESPAWGTEDYRRYAVLFNDITSTPGMSGEYFRFSDRVAIQRFLWHQGWRREVRPEDVTPSATDAAPQLTEHFLDPVAAICSCGWEPALGEVVWRAFDRHLLDVAPSITDAEEATGCDCGRDDRAGLHEFEQGCDSWDDDSADLPVPGAAGEEER